MKKLLILILIVLGVSACQVSEEPINPDNYDYYLLVVVSRQKLEQGNYSYVLHEAGESDNFTYESEELWSVGEFVIAIEFDEQENVYFTGLNTTTSMIVKQYQEKLVCDFAQFAVDMQVGFNKGYSIERDVSTDIIYELFNGEYTGNEFDYDYLFNKYCKE